jgi:hypothetical protein
VKPATEASAAANGETSRKKSSNPALRAMVSELMHWADEDGDAALSLTEFCRLQQQVCHHLRRNDFPFLLGGFK